MEATEGVKTGSGNEKRNPWLWVPSVYIAEGIPYMVVMAVSVVMYKNLGLSNTDIALYTSWLYLPWVIKPLWSPFVDLFLTKRFWILLTQLVTGGAFACVALTLPAADFVRYTLAILWIMAFSSATHDTATDGFYMLGLDTPGQAAFVGVRTAFYRVSTIAAKGGLVVLAGLLQKNGYPVASAWSLTFFVLAAVFLSLCLYHFFILPYPPADRSAPTTKGKNLLDEYLRIITLFFRRKDIVVIICFFLFYRFAEAQLVKMVAPFLLDAREKGGLGLSTAEVGWIYGTAGVVALMLGGILGGYAIYRRGLKFWLWPMVIITYGSGLVEVFATPAMIALMENTCYKSVMEFLPEGYGTVGTKVDIVHIKATAVGKKVSCKSELIEIDRKRLVFSVKAFDEDGEIGSGIHERFIINVEKFMGK